MDLIESAYFGSILTKEIRSKINNYVQLPMLTLVLVSWNIVPTSLR